MPGIDGARESVAEASSTPGLHCWYGAHTLKTGWHTSAVSFEQGTSPALDLAAFNARKLRLWVLEIVFFILMSRRGEMSLGWTATARESHTSPAPGSPSRGRRCSETASAAAVFARMEGS
eukprot:scaffold1100_cov254-Pinguiococcus_pyrenoidosus.AAC.3